VEELQASVLTNGLPSILTISSTNNSNLSQVLSIIMIILIVSIGKWNLQTRETPLELFISQISIWISNMKSEQTLNVTNQLAADRLTENLIDGRMEPELGETTNATCQKKQLN